MIKALAINTYIARQIIKHTDNTIMENEHDLNSFKPSTKIFKWALLIYLYNSSAFSLLLS